MYVDNSDLFILKQNKIIVIYILVYLLIILQNNYGLIKV